MITISPTYLFIWRKKTFVNPCDLELSGVFSDWGWESFTELFLSNIMKYDTNDIEWQTLSGDQGHCFCVGIYHLSIHKNNSPGSPDKDTLHTGSYYNINGELKEASAPYPGYPHPIWQIYHWTVINKIKTSQI